MLHSERLQLSQLLKSASWQSHLGLRDPSLLEQAQDGLSDMGAETSSQALNAKRELVKFLVNQKKTLQSNSKAILKETQQGWGEVRDGISEMKDQVQAWPRSWR